MIKVTVWNEFIHEQKSEKVREIYPRGIHNAIADFLGAEEDITVRTATLDMPECGLTQDVLDDTDVLIWWGHIGHDKVPDEVVFRVRDAVWKGMGMIFLHSAHFSKPFRTLMGTPCNLTWRESADSERIWVVEPDHPIAKGLDRFFDIPHVETYGEPFGIPTPDRIVFMGWYSGGEVFRSGVCYERYNGRIFYFQPGHETFPIFHQSQIQTVIKNAVRWAYKPSRRQLNAPMTVKTDSPAEYIYVKK